MRIAHSAKKAAVSSLRLGANPIIWSSQLARITGLFPHSIVPLAFAILLILSKSTIPAGIFQGKWNALMFSQHPNQEGVIDTI